MAALLSGLAPALDASKADVLSGLRNDAALVGRLRLRYAFVIGQVAFSIVLIIGGGLFIRALQRAASIDPGFDPHSVELIKCLSHAALIPTPMTVREHQRDTESEARCVDCECNRPYAGNGGGRGRDDVTEIMVSGLRRV